MGAAIVRALAARGASVFVHHGHSSDAANALAQEVRGLGVEAATGAADLADPTRAVDLVAAATESLGAISILVNNASSFPEDSLSDATLDGWHATLAVTLTAPIFLTQAFAASLQPSASSAVVNVSDARTETPYERHFTYTIAKGGLDTFTRAAATSLGPQVRVNAVAPGVALPPPGEGDEHIGRLAAALPLAGPGGAEPVAHATIALLENDFITGEILRVDGGGHLTTAVAAPAD